MNRSALRLEDYLGHILQAISRIEKYCADMCEVGFISSPITQDALIRNFEIIGEASKILSALHQIFLLHAQNCRCHSPMICATC